MHQDPHMLRGKASFKAVKVEPWRAHLFEQSSAVARVFKEQVGVLHEKVTDKAPQVECMRCEMKKYTLDIVDLECDLSIAARKDTSPVSAVRAGASTNIVKHRFCTKCVREMLAEQAHRRRQLQCAVSRETLHKVERLSEGKFAFLLCPLCRCPSVLVPSQGFQEGLARERMDSRLRYSVRIDITEILRDNTYVEEVYENQRRPFFGAFSAENLLVTDFRGAFSTHNAAEIDSLETFFTRPNTQWAWVDVWSPDLMPAPGHTVPPRNGWYYSSKWKAKDIEWSPEFDLFTFVRRRRLLRTRMRFNEEVRLEIGRVYSTKARRRGRGDGDSSPMSDNGNVDDDDDE